MIPPLGIENLQIEDHPFTKQLIWTLDEPFIPVMYQLQWLNRTRPHGILPCYMRQQGEKTQLCLDIGKRLPLTDCDPGKLWPDFSALALLEAMYAIFHEADNFLMPLDQFSLNAKLIFMDPSQPLHKGVWLAFWPVQSEDNTTNCEGSAAADPAAGKAFLRFLQDFETNDPLISEAVRCHRETLLRHPLPGLKRVIDQARPVDDADCKKAAAGKRANFRILTFCLDGLPLVLLAFLLATRLLLPPLPSAVYLFLAAISVMVVIGRSAHLIRRRNPPPSGFCQKLSQILVHRLGRSLRAKLAQIKKIQPKRQVIFPKTSSTPDGETLHLPADPKTFRIAVLTEARAGEPEADDPRKAYILVDNFIIGRDENNVDFLISEDQIGRQHACIQRKGGNFFIRDLGSKNGTWLDERRLPRQEDLPLPDQCCIRLAHLSFMFEAEQT